MEALHNVFLPLAADEQSTYTIKISFKDEDKLPATPNSLLWTLMTEDGQVINNRYKQAAVGLASTTYITMYGDDLQLVDRKELYETRVFTYEGTYNSSRGNNLPFNRQVFFRVRNIILVAIALSVEVTDTIFTDDYLKDINA